MAAEHRAIREAALARAVPLALARADTRLLATKAVVLVFLAAGERGRARDLSGHRNASIL
jgi:hypothetical protein